MAAQRPVHIDSTSGNVRELVAGDKLGGVTNGTATGEALTFDSIGVSVQAYSASTTLLGNTVTGTGSIVLATSPTLATPVLGVASATSLSCPVFSSAAAISMSPASASNWSVSLSGGANAQIVGGNVGIGLTPTSPLTVSGVIRTYRAGAASYMNVSAEAGVGTLESSNGWFYFNKTVGDWSNPTLVMTPAGDVGIGTTSPASKLHAISTTEQLRLGYDASNYLSTTVSSAGLATLETTGTNASITLTPSGTGNVIMSKIPRFNGTNSTGAGSSLLGANSPATTLTAPYTWISVITSDGSTAYIPCWK